MRKFFEKTGNDWSKRALFVPIGGHKYTLIDVDYVTLATQPRDSQSVQSKKMPLGRLSKIQIMRGYEKLRLIGEEIAENDESLRKLSSEYYSLIPHAFDFRGMCCERHFVRTLTYCCTKLRQSLPPSVNTNRRFRYWNQ